MKEAIITGANGFVGRHLVRELIQQGCKVWAIIRNDHKNNLEGINDIEIINCDMSEVEQLINKIQLKHPNDCVFYHLAWEGHSGTARGNYTLQIKNIQRTMNAANIAKQLGCNKFIMAGSVTQLMYKDYLFKDFVSPEIVTCYPIGKICADMMLKCVCKEIQLDYCWTYIANFYGEDDTTKNFINFLIDSYLDNSVPTLTPAEQLADFIHVSDVAKALVCVGEKGISKKSYYIGYGNPRPLKEYIQIIHDEINPSLETGIGLKPFEGQSVDYSKINCSSLSDDTGFKPEINFQKGILKTIAERRKLNV